MYLDELPSTRVTDMRRSGAVTFEMTHIAVTLQRDSGHSIYERRDECRTLHAVAGPWAAAPLGAAMQMNRSLRLAIFDRIPIQTRFPFQP